MQSTARPLFVALAAFAIVATDVTAQDSRTPRKDANHLLLEEIKSTSARNVYELVQSQRPQWLRVNGRQTMRTTTVQVTDGRGNVADAKITDEPPIVVYLNNARFGTVDSLRDLPLDNITALEFVPPARATLLWGGGHIHGAIVVHTSAESMP